MEEYKFSFLLIKNTIKNSTHANIVIQYNIFKSFAFCREFKTSQMQGIFVQ